MKRLINTFKNFLSLPPITTKESERISRGIGAIVERARIVAYVKKLANRPNMSESNRMTLLMAMSYIEKLHHQDDVKLFGEEHEEDQEDYHQSKED